jgi:eukaryotic-like serine/threonine-protein kinase
MLDLQVIGRNFQDLSNITPIAQGGQKTVYRATHGIYGNVVLKIILNPDQRIQREIDTVTQCNFTYVPKLYESRTMSYGPWQAMCLIEQFIQGETLRQRLICEYKLDITTAIHLLRDLLNAAVQLEQHLLVHRDIKPENIILDRNGTSWLLDFGIVRDLSMDSLTATDAQFGPRTLGYAAPEQIRNRKREIDSRADLFSIGVVTYEALSGEHPFKSAARDDLDVLYRTETFNPKPVKVVGDSQKLLSGFINTLIDKHISRRPKTAEQALKWFLALLPTVKHNI